MKFTEEVNRNLLHVHGAHGHPSNCHCHGYGYVFDCPPGGPAYGAMQVQYDAMHAHGIRRVD